MTNPTATDHEFEFALVLTGVGELTREAEDALFEAGCDDATICARGGRVTLLFTRAAASRDEAIRTAIRDATAADVAAGAALDATG